MRRILATATIAGTFVLSMVAPSFAVTAKSTLYHDGDIVRTLVNTSRLPNGGSDPFYAVTNGVEGQLGIAGVAPGDGPYHGGAWAVNVVTFEDGVTPYLLTSDEDVFAAETAGDVTVTRAPEMDFRCPLLP
jgi:hypothetical protein